MPPRARPAPTTATDAGSKKGRSEACAATAARSAFCDSCSGVSSSDRTTSITPCSFFDRTVKPESTKTPQHAVIHAHYPAVEGADVLTAGVFGQQFEQPGTEATALHLVGHQEGGFGARRGGSLARILRQGHDGAPAFGDQRELVARVRGQEPVDVLGVRTLHPEVAKVDAVWGEPAEKRPQTIGIDTARGAQADGRPILEDNVIFHRHEKAHLDLPESVCVHRGWRSPCRAPTVPGVVAALRPDVRFVESAPAWAIFTDRTENPAGRAEVRA